MVYLTTQPKNDLPTHVIIRSTGRDSIALCEQITSVSKERFGNYICTLTSDEQQRVDIALLISLAISGEKAETEKKAPPAPQTAPKQEAPAPKPAPAPPAPVETATRAKLEAERDVYKALYEGLLARLLPVERGA